MNDLPPGRPKPPRRRRQPTVLDIAALTGVSRSTVSRVLNGSDRVSAETERRVKRAIDQLGYHVNLSARALRTSRSALVGLLIPSIRNESFAEIAERMHASLSEHSIGMIIGTSDWHAEGDQLCLDMFESRGVDAVVCAAADDRDEQLAGRLEALRVPVILLDRDSVSGGFDAVLTDHGTGVSGSIEHLAALGHRRIGLKAPSINTRPGRETASAYRRTIKAFDLDDDPRLVVLSDEFDQRAGTATATALARAGATAIVVCGTVSLVGGALLGLEEGGLRVPDDMSFVAYCEPGLGALIRPRLALIVRPLVEEGDLVSSLVISRLESWSEDPRVEVVPTRFVPGASTAQLPPHRVTDTERQLWK